VILLARVGGSRMNALGVAVWEQRLGIAERACADAQASSRSKDEFLAMLGHELRNSLSAVRNAVVAARLDRRRSERALEIAWRQTEQLDRLITDILDIPLVEQGRVRLKRRVIPLIEIIEHAVETTSFLVEERGHVLSVSLPADRVRVNGDPVRLEQVVVNLIINAAKYTECGGRIDLFVERDSAEAVLRVRDNGKGISADVLPRIFDLFFQGERTLEHTQGGFGIGLSVVRSLVSLHDGRIEAHSDGLGKGAEFVVHLPAAPMRESEPAASSRPILAQTRDSQCLRVLVVEDNPDAAESLMMLLQVSGHQVSIARDGPTAIRLACADVPDLMLVDVGLPGMDGCEVARRARRTPELREVWLVAFTGYGSDEDHRRTLGAGFDLHLTKPVNPADLRELLARHNRAPSRRPFLSGLREGQR